MKKLLYITNIPAPYRQKRFNLMQEIFPKYGLEFEVLYMAEIEPDRKWLIPKDSYKYNYKIFKGIHPTVGGFFAHFNPGLLMRLLKNDYEIAIVGGMASPTHWLAPFFISNKKIKVMSVESNMHSTIRKKGFGAMLKRILFNTADAFQVTGAPQIEYIKFFSKRAENKKFIKMPNLVDEEVFRDKVAVLRANQIDLRESFGVDDNTQMWVLPARLISIKGILPFLGLLKDISNVRLFLMGDGEQKEEMLGFIKQEKLDVEITGFVQQAEVVRYYAAADLFVLPSIKDASPLSPIEASAAGLPLLVSSRIGNLEDVLENNVNGWHYDPITEIEKGKAIVNAISKLSREELEKMGKKSRGRYNEIFDSVKCVEEFAKELSTL
jgi:glycosyltransferase involved in cell wall biosynthesis